MNGRTHTAALATLAALLTACVTEERAPPPVATQERHLTNIRQLTHGGASLFGRNPARSVIVRRDHAVWTVARGLEPTPDRVAGPPERARLEQREASRTASLGTSDLGTGSGLGSAGVGRRRPVVVTYTSDGAGRIA